MFTEWLRQIRPLLTWLSTKTFPIKTPEQDGHQIEKGLEAGTESSLGHAIQRVVRAVRDGVKRMFAQKPAPQSDGFSAALMGYVNASTDEERAVLEAKLYGLLETANDDKNTPYRLDPPTVTLH